MARTRMKEMNRQISKTTSDSTDRRTDAINGAEEAPILNDLDATRLERGLLLYVGRSRSHGVTHYSSCQEF